MPTTQPESLIPVARGAYKLGSTGFSSSTTLYRTSRASTHDTESKNTVSQQANRNVIEAPLAASKRHFAQEADRPMNRIARTIPRGHVTVLHKHNPSLAPPGHQFHA